MSDTQQANSVQPRKRRGAELVLLVLALGVAVGAYAVVGVAVTGHVSQQIVSYAAGLVLLVGIAHLVVRFRAPYADPILLPCVVAAQRPRPGPDPPARPVQGQGGPGRR